MKLRALVSCLAVVGARYSSPDAALAAESPLGFDLVWEAPLECPPVGDVSRQIVELLGREATNLPDFQVRGSVSRVAEGGYVLLLETVRGAHHGSRTMRDQSCAELSAAGAAVIALAIDPDFEKRAAEASPEPEAPAKPPTPPKPPAPPPRSIVERAESAPIVKPEPRGNQSFEISLVAAVAADIGTLPEFSAGPALSLLARYDFALFGITGLWLPEQRTYVSGSSSVGGDFDFMGLAFSGCVDPWGRTWALAGCMGLGFGRVHASGTGATINSATNVSWASAQAGVLFRVPILQALLVESAFDLVIPLQSASFVVENSGLVYEPASASARLRAGLAWRFW